MSLLSVTVLKYNNQTVNTPYQKFLGIENIKLITSENYDYFNDHAYLLYYNNQSMITERYIVSQTAAALKTTIQATADTAQNTAMFPAPVFLNKIDRRPMGKLSLLNTDAVENLTPEAVKPAKVIYDLGNVNQAKHKELEWCSYPLIVTAIDTSNNTITIACCVDNFLVYNTSVSIGDAGTFTVLSSVCTDSGGVVLISQSIAAIEVGDEVSLT